MKIAVNREVFESVWHKVAMVAPRNSPKAVLNSICIVAESDGVFLLATDMECSVRVKVASDSCVVMSPGRSLLPVGRVSQIIKESSDTELTLEVAGSILSVRSGRSEFELPTENVDEFPGMPTHTGIASWCVNGELLKQAIRRTKYACDVTSSRYALGGLFVECQDGEANVVATDGRRMAVTVLPVSDIDGSVHDLQPVISSRGVALAERVFDGDESVRMSLSPSTAVFESATCWFATRLVEGRYPAWRNVFPKCKEAFACKVGVGVLHQAVRQASVTIDKETHGIDFTFDRDGWIVLRAVAEVGQSKVDVRVDIQGLSSDAVTVRLDAQFISDYLQSLTTSDFVTIEFVSHDRAVVFKNSDVIESTYIVMPMAKAVAA